MDLTESTVQRASLHKKGIHTHTQIDGRKSWLNPTTHKLIASGDLHQQYGSKRFASKTRSKERDWFAAQFV